MKKLIFFSAIILSTCNLAVQDTIILRDNDNGYCIPVIYDVEHSDNFLYCYRTHRLTGKPFYPKENDSVIYGVAYIQPYPADIHPSPYNYSGEPREKNIYFFRWNDSTNNLNITDSIGIDTVSSTHYLRIPIIPANQTISNENITSYDQLYEYYNNIKDTVFPLCEVFFDKPKRVVGDSVYGIAIGTWINAMEGLNGFPDGQYIGYNKELFTTIGSENSCYGFEFRKIENDTLETFSTVFFGCNNENVVGPIPHAAVFPIIGRERWIEHIQQNCRGVNNIRVDDIDGRNALAHWPSPCCPTRQQAMSWCKPPKP